jgi:TetR/AcrR family fatty acid metabolism transcriptional regulator
MSIRASGREEKRQAILQAARQVFARRGYEPATLEAVAREAGLAKGTLYLYFKNKEDLYFHTLLSMLEGLQACIRAQTEQATGAVQKMRAIAAGQFDFFVRHRDTLQLFASFSNPSLARLHRRLIAPMMEKWAGYVQYVTALVEEGKRAGELRPDIGSRQVALAFLGMTSQAAQALVRTDPAHRSGAEEAQATPEAMADTILRILTEGVMHR